jgi:hypothetical protein
MRYIVLLAALAIASPAVAQDRLSTWEPQDRVNTANLALAGMKQTGTAGWALPDGRQVVVTFWSYGAEEARAAMRGRSEYLGEYRDTLVWRCVTVLDASFAQVEETCVEAKRPAE